MSKFSKYLDGLEDARIEIMRIREKYSEIADTIDEVSKTTNYYEGCKVGCSFDQFLTDLKEYYYLKYKKHDCVSPDKINHDQFLNEYIDDVGEDLESLFFLYTSDNLIPNLDLAGYKDENKVTIWGLPDSGEDIHDKFEVCYSTNDPELSSYYMKNLAVRKMYYVLFQRDGDFRGSLRSNKKYKEVPVLH